MAREVAGFIRSEVHRTNELVTRFLNFTRPSPLQKELASLNDVIRGAVSQLREQVKGRADDIQIKQDLQEVPRFSFDATLIESAVLNLLLNGYEAMSSGGTLLVRTRRDGSMARIEVVDSGVGIKQDQMENIFNPFFTTKPTGVGLGLAMVSKFVDSHGGKISVDSKAGHGATFRVLLPLET